MWPDAKWSYCQFPPNVYIPLIPQQFARADVFLKLINEPRNSFFFVYSWGTSARYALFQLLPSNNTSINSSPASLRNVITFRNSTNFNIYHVIWFWISTSCDTASRHLPHDQPVAVDVGHDVRVEVVFTQAFVEDLWSHVAPGSCTSAQRDVNFITVTERQEKERLVKMDRCSAMSQQVIK